MCCKTANHPHWRTRHRRHHGRGHWKNKFMSAWSYPPVNVEELDDYYEIQLFAAGYVKSDFKITLEANTMRIAVEKPDTDESEKRHSRQLEFKPGSFERYFELNDKIDTESIVAKYEEGVLKVTLPKLAGAEKSHQNIDVN
ncbi:MAG: Hsp20/alpha crystallin family protein [Chitinophagales bacterium]